jgi:hypothetical protein
MFFGRTTDNGTLTAPAVDAAEGLDKSSVASGILDAIETASERRCVGNAIIQHKRSLLQRNGVAFSKAYRLAVVATVFDWDASPYCSCCDGWKFYDGHTIIALSHMTPFIHVLIILKVFYVLTPTLG